MLPRVARLLLRAGAAAFVVFGVVSFAVPGWASEQFPWKVGPFLAMSIGGWSLGTAAFAWLAARDAQPARVYPLIVYLLVFALGELLVVVAFAGKLRMNAPLTYPYLAGLVAVALGSVVLAAQWLKSKPNLHETSGAVPRWARVIVILFVLFVGGLSFATLVSGPDGAAARGLVFPESMGLFSIRAFSAFFLALAIGGLSLLNARNVAAFDELGRAGLLLVVPITLAAFANIGLFDVVVRPGSLLYLMAYVVAGGLLAVRVIYVRNAVEPGTASMTVPPPFSR